LDLRTGNELGRLRGHTADIRSLTFTVDGSALVSAGADTTALVWESALLTPPPNKPIEFQEKELTTLWADLADADAGRAYRAVITLGAAPKEAVALLSKHLRPAVGPDEKTLRLLLADLAGNSAAAREKAATELTRLGELARPALEEALKGQPPETVRRQMQEIVNRLNAGPPLADEELRAVRAVEVLEGLNTPEARRVLEALAGGAAGARLTREAKAALDRSTVRPDRKEP
jgi:hypothetical protein